jgi:type VII secretion protein EccB
LQLSGDRFLRHRVERALLHGDVHADDDSPRAQCYSLLTGVLAAALAVALCAALAVVRPQQGWGDAEIVMVRGTGAVYVRVDGVVHPVLNLTSGWLVTGTRAAPRQVAAAAVHEGERGALLGIPGAPLEIGEPVTEPQWTVCDHEATTVVAGALGPGAQLLGPEQAILATGPSGTPYLLSGGRRARVDLTDPGVVKALGADGVQPAVVSGALLDTVPEVAPIVTPVVPGAGFRGPAALPGFTVGEVVQVRAASATEFYVVLGGGVQRVGQVAADVLRHSAASSSVTAVAPSILAALPELGVLPMDLFPERVDTLTGAGHSVCVSWRPGSVELLTGPISAASVQLAQADGAGPRTDAVSLPAGRSAYVYDGTSEWLVTELGTRFRVEAEAARVLGLADPIEVPRAIVDALPRGPVLSRSAALTAHDVIPAATS